MPRPHTEVTLDELESLRKALRLRRDADHERLISRHRAGERLRWSQIEQVIRRSPRCVLLDRSISLPPQLEELVAAARDARLDVSADGLDERWPQRITLRIGERKADFPTDASLGYRQPSAWEVAHRFAAILPPEWACLTTRDAWPRSKHLYALLCPRDAAAELIPAFRILETGSAAGPD